MVLVEKYRKDQSDPTERNKEPFHSIALLCRKTIDIERMRIKSNKMIRTTTQYGPCMCQRVGTSDYSSWLRDCSHARFGRKGSVCMCPSISRKTVVERNTITIILPLPRNNQHQLQREETSSNRTQSHGSNDKKNVEGSTTWNPLKCETSIEQYRNKDSKNRIESNWICHTLGMVSDYKELIEIINWKFKQ